MQACQKQQTDNFAFRETFSMGSRLVSTVGIPDFRIVIRCPVTLVGM